MRDKRDALMADIRDQMIVGAKRFGLDVVDVRIKRADLPAENSEAVFRRMQTERQQRAASYRAQGSQQSQQIKAEADRKVTVITAQAQQQSEQIRGEGDGERNRIFAEAYGADPDFFAFYRSMQAYENSFANGRTRALISPKSDFFRYFSTPNPAPETATPPAAVCRFRAFSEGGLEMATASMRPVWLAIEARTGLAGGAACDAASLAQAAVFSRTDRRI